MVERAKAGDKCVFTGTFIVVPDVSQLGLPGVNSEMQREASRHGGVGGLGNQGVTGLKTLGVRDLQYKTAFLACMVNDSDARVSYISIFRFYHNRCRFHSGTVWQAQGINVRPDDFGGELIEEDQQAYINSLTEPEIQELTSMVHQDYIYMRLINSIAPTVWGASWHTCFGE